MLCIKLIGKRLMNSVDKYLHITKLTKVYILQKSLYFYEEYMKDFVFGEIRIVALCDNIPVKFAIQNKNLQELFNRDYGLENLQLKIDYDNPYQILEIK